MISSLFTFAQNLKINVPSSGFGIGEYSNQGNSRNAAMGNLNVVSPNRMYLNLVNPALLTNTKYTVFEGGLEGQFRLLKQNNSLQFNKDLFPAYLALAFPVSKNWKSSFSLQPYTFTNYSSTVETAVSGSSSETTTTTSSGNGGTYKFAFTNGFKLNPNLSVGLAASYLFGNKEEFIQSQSSTATNYTTLSDDYNYKAFQFKTGLSFRKELKTITIKKRSKLVAHNKNYLSKAQQINTCLESGDFADSVDYKERIKICKKDIQKYEKKVVFEDTLFNKNTLFAKYLIDSVAEHIINGNLFSLIPNYSDLVFDPTITSKLKVIKITNLLKEFNTKGYGIFVKKEAVKATDSELRSEITDLILNKKTNDIENNNQVSKKYLRRASGVFLNVGFTSTLSSKMDVELNSYENRYTSDGSLITSDTVLGKNGNINLPLQFALGFSLDKPKVKGIRKDGSLKKSVWSIGTQLFYYNGNQYSNELEGNDLNNSYGISFGAEYVPDINAKLKSEGSKRIFYRLGAYARKMPYQINNKSVEDIGISFGFGIPIGNYDLIYSYPKYLNLSFQIGQKAMLNKGQIREQYFLTTLSFSINDKWFKRAKLGL